MSYVSLYKKNEKDIREIDDIINKNMQSEILDFLGKGYSADVYTFDDFTVKIYNNKNEGSYMYSTNDFDILLRLKNNLYFPKLYGYKEGKYVVMEYIDGYTLKEISDMIKKQRNIEYINIPFNYKELITKAIKYVLSQNILPIDIHAENIIINNKGNIKIIDVGNYVIKEDEVFDKKKNLKDICSFLFSLSSFKIIDKYLNKEQI